MVPGKFFPVVSRRGRKGRRKADHSREKSAEMPRSAYETIETPQQDAGGKSEPHAATGLNGVGPLGGGTGQDAGVVAKKPAKRRRTCSGPSRSRSNSPSNCTNTSTDSSKPPQKASKHPLGRLLAKCAEAINPSKKQKKKANKLMRQGCGGNGEHLPAPPDDDTSPSPSHRGAQSPAPSGGSLACDKDRGGLSPPPGTLEGADGSNAANVNEGLAPSPCEGGSEGVEGGIVVTSRDLEAKDPDEKVLVGPPTEGDQTGAVEQGEAAPPDGVAVAGPRAQLSLRGEGSASPRPDLEPPVAAEKEGDPPPQGAAEGTAKAPAKPKRIPIRADPRRDVRRFGLEKPREFVKKSGRTQKMLKYLAAAPSGSSGSLESPTPSLTSVPKGARRGVENAGAPHSHSASAASPAASPEASGSPAAASGQGGGGGNTPSAPVKSQTETEWERQARHRELVKAEGLRLDKRLKRLKMRQEYTGGDGNCQFRAISNQLYDTEFYHLYLRRTAVRHIQSNRDQYMQFVGDADDFHDYVELMAQTRQWGDELTLRALADCLHLDVHLIVSTPGNWILKYPSGPQDQTPPVSPTPDGEGGEKDKGKRKKVQRKAIFLAYTSPVHYNSAVPDNYWC